MAEVVSRSCGKKWEELVWAGVERGAPEPLGTTHKHPGRDAAMGIQVVKSQWMAAAGRQEVGKSGAEYPL